MIADVKELLAEVGPPTPIRATGEYKLANLGMTLALDTDYGSGCEGCSGCKGCEGCKGDSTIQVPGPIIEPIIEHLLQDPRLAQVLATASSEKE